jgi:hypothetical protein
VTAQTVYGDTPLHSVSTQFSWWKPEGCARVADILLKNGADVNARNKDGLTPFRRASQAGSEEVKRVLLKHGADPGEMPASDSESPPLAVTSSPTHTLADLPIPSHPSLSTLNIADTDLPPTPSQLEPPSNEILILERHRPTVFLTRRFLCSLGIVAIAVALPFFYEVSRRC